MKNTSLKTLATVAIALALGGIAKADPIVTGGISFSSLGNGFTPGSLDSTNPILDIKNQIISSVSGPGTTFGSLTLGSSGDAGIIFSPIQLTGNSPAFVSAAVIGGGDLWSFTSGGETYSFTATSANVVDNSTSWTVAGNGTFDVTGVTNYAVTAGTYFITLSGDGQVTQVGSTNNANVPDSGTTAMLVGLGMLVMGAYAFRSKFAKI